MGKKSTRNGEEYFIEKYAGMGLVQGSLVIVDKDIMHVPQVGEKLPCGYTVTEADVETFNRIVPKGVKQVMLRECQETGDMFWLATSDIWQTRYSPAVRKAKQREKAREGRKARNATLKAENEQLKAQVAEMAAEAQAISA